MIDSPLNKRLISRLTENGAEVLVFPPLKTSPAEISVEAVEIIKNPTTFEWIIFTDVFAAEYFIEAMREQATDFFALDELKVCAHGEAVADRLRFDQIHSDIIPANSNDEIVFSTISQYAGDKIDGENFLILRENSTPFRVAEMLLNEGASIYQLPVYAAAFDDEKELTKLKTLLKGGAVDEFIFSSAEDILALKLLFTGEDLAENLTGIKAFATTEIAFQTLQEYGLRPLYFHYK